MRTDCVYICHKKNPIKIQDYIPVLNICVILLNNCIFLCSRDI